MLVPAPVIELDEPDAALGETPGQQTVRSIGAGLAGVGAIQFEDVLGLFR